MSGARRLILALTVVAAGLVTPAAKAQSPLKTVTVRLGWQPLGGGSAAINMVMMRDKLFEKAAEHNRWRYCRGVQKRLGLQSTS